MFFQGTFFEATIASALASEGYAIFGLRVWITKDAINKEVAPKAPGVAPPFHYLEEV